MNDLYEEQIKKIKEKYPTMGPATKTDIMQPFGDDWPEFVAISDDEWFKYEFIDGEFVRGAHMMVELKVLGFTQFLRESDNPAKDLKEAFEGEVLGYILQHGVHPRDVFDDVWDEVGFSLGVNEGTSDPHRLTKIGMGRYPEDAVWESDND